MHLSHPLPLTHQNLLPISYSSPPLKMEFVTRRPTYNILYHHLIVWRLCFSACWHLKSSGELNKNKQKETLKHYRCAHTKNISWYAPAIFQIMACIWSQDFFGYFDGFTLFLFCFLNNHFICQRPISSQNSHHQKLIHQIIKKPSFVWARLGEGCRAWQGVWLLSCVRRRSAFRTCSSRSWASRKVSSPSYRKDER